MSEDTKNFMIKFGFTMFVSLVATIVLIILVPSVVRKCDDHIRHYEDGSEVCEITIKEAE